jgi:hypothetical protein
VHEKRRDHACPYCKGVAFGEKGTLKMHIETLHEKRRDHACGFCKGVRSDVWPAPTKLELRRWIIPFFQKR